MSSPLFCTSTGQKYHPLVSLPKTKHQPTNQPTNQQTNKPTRHPRVATNFPVGVGPSHYLSWSMPIPGLSGHGLNTFTGRTVLPRVPTQTLPAATCAIPCLCPYVAYSVDPNFYFLSCWFTAWPLSSPLVSLEFARIWILCTL